MFRQIRLLVFDLDYLVFDCGLLKAHALRESLIAFADAIPQGARLPDGADIETAFRDYGHRWARHLDLGLDEDVALDVERAYQIRERHLIERGVGRIYPGVEQALTTCREAGISCALGAEASRDYLMAVSDHHDLDQYFDLSLCTEEYGLGSAQEMLGDLLNQAEVNPSEVLVLGTRPAMFEAGHSLDLLTLGCGWGIHLKDSLETADFHVSSVAQIIPVARRADEIAAEYAG